MADLGICYGYFFLIAIFLMLQKNVFGHKKFQISCTGSKVWTCAWNLKKNWPKAFLWSIMKMAITKNTFLRIAWQAYRLSQLHALCINQPQFGKKVHYVIHLFSIQIFKIVFFSYFNLMKISFKWWGDWHGWDSIFMITMVSSQK